MNAKAHHDQAARSLYNYGSVSSNSNIDTARNKGSAPWKFLLAHVVLGMATGLVAEVATLYFFVVVGVLVWALFFSRRLEHLVFLSGYVATVDVAWRLTGSLAPYHINKYMLIAIMIAILVRFIPHPQSIASPLIYLFALMPAAVFLLITESPSWIRSQISATLLGPIILGLGVVVFRQLVLTRDEMLRFLWFSLNPIISTSVALLIRVGTTANINYTTGSNIETSGGFGPSQVATILSLGCVICVLISVSGQTIRVRLWLIGLCVALLAQAVFTFSRGGLYSFLAALLAVVVMEIFIGYKRSRFIVGVIIGLSMFFLLFGWMNGMSDGLLQARIKDRDTTHRGTIASADLALFRENPITGVGIGNVKTERVTPGLRMLQAHTEQSRLLAEHGILGVVALCAMGQMMVDSVKRAGRGWNQQLAVAFLVWSFVTMAHASTRIASTTFFFSVAAVRLNYGRPSDSSGVSRFSGATSQAGWRREAL